MDKEIELLLRYNDFEAKNEHLKSENAGLQELLKGKEEEVGRLKKIIERLAEKSESLKGE